MQQSDYQSTIEYLYSQLPVFQQVGASAYKPGLDTVMRLSEAFGAPHKRLRCIHVAGTNGKGSTCHTLAAVLQSCGHRTGLFTSPHLLDFRERIRVDGAMVPEDFVVDFVNRYRAMNLELEPSFFELTTVMAFDYFVRSGVDYAVIEVGLGGRLDSTNIITPLLSIITNISLDHTSLLGDTPAAIAREKAGIIKPGIPAVVGEAEGAVREVFEEKAAEVNAPLRFVADDNPVLSATLAADGYHYENRLMTEIVGELTGECQPLNAATVLTAVEELRRVGVELPDDAVATGFRSVQELTHIMGRWTRLSADPLVICDTGHNPGGWRYIAHQLAKAGSRRHIVVGFVGDKDVDTILQYLAAVPDATFYFTAPDCKRALPAFELASKAAAHGLQGDAFERVTDAYEKALAVVGKGEMVFVGGSNFVVADLLASFTSKQ